MNSLSFRVVYLIELWQLVKEILQHYSLPLTSELWLGEGGSLCEGKPYNHLSPIQSQASKDIRLYHFISSQITFLCSFHNCRERRWLLLKGGSVSEMKSVGPFEGRWYNVSWWRRFFDRIHIDHLWWWWDILSVLCSTCSTFQINNLPFVFCLCCSSEIQHFVVLFGQFKTIYVFLFLQMHVLQYNNWIIVECMSI